MVKMYSFGLVNPQFYYKYQGYPMVTVVLWLGGMTKKYI